MKKPLILLDVDGVINDFEQISEEFLGWDVDVVHSHGYDVRIPHYMPALIRDLCRVAEVHWCTTWRSRANDDIAVHLGIDPLPVVDDGTNIRYTDWKAAAAYDLIEEALNDGRRVLWCEDFWGTPPAGEVPHGTEFLDTTENSPGPLLIPENIPTWLKELIDGALTSFA